MLTSTALVPFSSWSVLLTYLAGPSADREVRFVWYKAPMDLNAHLVRVVRIFKNGKVRIDPGHAHADPFTADPAHLDRFYMRREVVTP